MERTGGSSGAFPEQWFRLDAVARKAMKDVEKRISRLTPMGAPVGATPAGNYVGCYWQDGECHPIAAQHLKCVATDALRGLASGHGVDDVGDFNMHGEYIGTRLCLTKTYVLGTGDPEQNLGHSVELRLQYTELAAALPSRRANELRGCGAPPGAVGLLGTWHIRVPDGGYEGDAEMCLWLPPEPVAIGYVIAVGTPVDGGASSSGGLKAALLG